MSTLGFDPAAGPAPTIQIPAGGAPAPELGALAAPDQAPGAPGPSPGAAPAGGEDEAIQHLQDAIDAITAYQDVEPDAVDKAAAAKLLAQLHGLLAKDQQDRDAATGGALNPRLLRKAGAIQ